MEIVIAHIDSCCSRARHALIYNSFRPETGDTLELNNARHPLVKGAVVPLTIRMTGRTRVLIITGPNTGGKTVTLKTVGLMALMHQFGLQIPCDMGSKLPVFDNVFADIGDEQSIEQCLSTFSGHIRNMSHIIRVSTGASLVLLDELGSGTDPEEGVAIAMSILDHFIAKGCRVVTSTHHGILKNYGYTRPEAVNASMEFDPEKLLPTYRIIMGIPGESYALPIAKRHGIPQEVIDNANAYLNEERTDISGMIKNLSEKHRELLQEEERQKMTDRELTEKLRNSDLKELRLKQKEIELREHGLKELKSFLGQSRRELENIIRGIREGELTKDKIKSVKDYLASIEDKVNDEDRRLSSREEELDKGPGFAFAPGMSVRVKSTLSKGTIIRRGRKDTWVVETDTLKAAFSERELEPLKTSPNESKVEVHAAALGTDVNAVFNLDVRGQRLEEALKNLEKQMDGAVLKGLKEFMIIHGKGEGILMHGIHEYLRNCQFVKDYFFSTPEEGGFGKTVVVLKE
jgi:DNA mismatch repair protein MutS2